MYAIAALNETRQELHGGRILLRPEQQVNTMRAAARRTWLAVNLIAGEHLQNRNDDLPTVDHPLPHLEWSTRLPILFGETPNAIE